MLVRSLVVASAALVVAGCSQPAAGPAGVPAQPDAAPAPATEARPEPVAVPAVAATPAIPTHCTAGEQVVFSCGAGDRVISLCAIGTSPARMQYRFGRKGAVELAWPTPAAAPKGAFFVSSTPYAGGGERRIRFASGDYSYYLFSRTIAGEWDDEGHRPHIFEDGVIVFRSGKLVSDKRCTTDVDASGQDRVGEALDEEPFNDALEIPYKPAGQ